MKLTATNDLFASQPSLHCPCLSSSSSLPRRHGLHLPINLTKKNNSVSIVALSDSDPPSSTAFSRRAILLAPPLLSAAASLFLKPSLSLASEDNSSATVTSPAGPATPPVVTPPPPPPPPTSVNKEETITSRIYDATAIGEPMAMGKDKKKVWEKLMNARVVYLGEAEQVPTKDDKEVELEIVRNLRKRCLESERQISVALEAFPLDLQEQLNQYMDKRIDGETLKSYVTDWPAQLWQEYEPLLTYCRDNAVRLIACGIPLKVLRTVQAEGIRGLSKSERKLYTPPAGSGFISGFSSFSRRSTFDMSLPTQIVPFGPSSYLSAQARVVEDHTMSQVILQAVADGGGTGLLLVVTGASHVEYGSRGTGLPARISRKFPKKNQVVVLLDPERQYLRREGETPVADFLWYSAARPCSRNCFDRAEIARVMNAAGRRRDALPQDIQNGLDLGLVSPEVLQNLFDLEQYPLISELAQRFQGFRERLLADPKFLNRLAIEEAISITTTLIAQYEKRKENFFEELDYVITDTVRGSVVDFFTVWLPAPTLSFLSYADETNGPDSIEALRGLLGSIPDNAFQKSLAGREWNLNLRVAAVIVGGLKLAGVGVVSSVAAVGASNALNSVRKVIKPELVVAQKPKRSPLLKTAMVYGGFLGTSANLRYQIIAGLIEHRISDELSSQPLLVNTISFVVRTLNSYFGTQQWIDLARSTGLQSQKSTPASKDVPEVLEETTVECNATEEENVDKQSNLNIFLDVFAHILEEQWQVDVLLKAGDSDPDAAISAHKLVLAARSKVFKKMLEEDECKTSSEKEIITLSEMKHEELKALVEFIYSDGSTPCAGHARSLYLAADKYEIPHLRDLTRNELISSLNASNALDVYELAQIPFDDALNNAALSCIRMNIATIAYSDELKLFAESNPNLTVEIMKACVEQSRIRNYTFCILE